MFRCCVILVLALFVGEAMSMTEVDEQVREDVALLKEGNKLPVKWEICVMDMTKDAIGLRHQLTEENPDEFTFFRTGASTAFQQRGTLGEYVLTTGKSELCCARSVGQLNCRRNVKPQDQCYAVAVRACYTESYTMYEQHDNALQFRHFACNAMSTTTKSVNLALSTEGSQAQAMYVKRGGDYFCCKRGAKSKLFCGSVKSSSLQEAKEQDWDGADILQSFRGRPGLAELNERNSIDVVASIKQKGELRKAFDSATAESSIGVTVAVCVMELNNDALEIHGSLKNFLWRSVAAADKTSNIGTTTITLNIPQAKGTTACCVLQGSWYQCRLAAARTCYVAAVDACRFDREYSIPLSNLMFKTVACSDLQANEKTVILGGLPVVNSLWMIKSSDGEFSCCQSLINPNNAEHMGINCGPLDVKDEKSKQLSKIEALWDKVDMVKRASMYTSPSASFLNELNNPEAVFKEETKIDLSAVVGEARKVHGCSRMLWSLVNPDTLKANSNELALIFLTMTDMMFQQTNRLLHWQNDKHALLWKTLLRSYARFIAATDASSDSQTLSSTFSKWWETKLQQAQDLKTPLSELPPVPKDIKVSCVLADTLFSQDLERLGDNSRMNDVRKDLVMSGVKVITAAVKAGIALGASAASAAIAAGTHGAGAIAGAAVGAAATLLGGAILDGMEMGLDRLIGDSNKVGRIRREGRAAILQGYRNLLYKEDKYADGTACSNAVKEYLEVVHAYLTTSTEQWLALKEKATECVYNKKINEIKDYGHAFMLLGRLQGYKQRTLEEVDGTLAMFNDVSKDLVAKNVGSIEETWKRFDEYLKESKAVASEKEKSKQMEELLQLAKQPQTTDKKPEILFITESEALQPHRGG